MVKFNTIIFAIFGIRKSKELKIGHPDELSVTPTG